MQLNHNTLSTHQLFEFLEDHRVAKGSEFTHTSLGTPLGSFYIPYEDVDKFHTLYKGALRNKTSLFMTEKHKSVSPICIDLDLRFPLGEMQRKYSSSQIEKLIKIYVSKLSQYVDFNTCKVYVLEKPSPRTTDKEVKDGIHVIIPNIITTPTVQYLVRQQCLNEMNEILCGEIGCTNSIDDIFDHAVIEKNNWLMYGSTKPNSHTYEVTNVFDVSSTGELNNISTQNEDYVDLFSIRNKCIPCNVKNNKLQEIQSYEERLKKKTKNTCISQNSNTSVKNECDNLDEIEKLVDMLSTSRAEVFDDWIKLGWCLRNIDHRLLSKWDEFSKNSSKYVAGECAKLWSRMKIGGLGIASLHMWAKQDNPTVYTNSIRSSLHSLIETSMSATHYDVAQVIHKMFKHQFVCSSINRRTWYVYKNHRWHEDDAGCTLRMKIPVDVWKEYSNFIIVMQQKSLNSEIQVDQDRYMGYAKKLMDVARKLKLTNFKDSIMKECSEVFYQPDFEEKLDSNLSLIGFENGVYDLDNKEFRDGRPEDYISFTTGNEYIPYDPDHPAIHGVQTYLQQVITNYDVREYVLKLLGSFLHGSIKDQKFYIWTGSGSNSKSKLIELFEKSYGDYCCKFPITLLTQKRAASNAANSEVARSKGKRFASLQEPSEDEQINIGLMKEYSGGDRIMARQIYKEPIEFNPQFKMLLLCNHLPNVPSDDGGTWRRIRVVEFKSKFVDNPVPERNEFPIDLDLSEKLDNWKPYFISMLIHYYDKYKQHGIHEPDEVLQCTNEYKNQNDHVANFISEFIISHEPTSFLSLAEIFSEYKAWIRNDGINAKLPTKSDLGKTISKHINAKIVLVNNTKGFKGFTFKSYCDDEDEDEEKFD